jgi:hypothetical protein
MVKKWLHPALCDGLSACGISHVLDFRCLSLGQPRMMPFATAHRMVDCLMPLLHVVLAASAYSGTAPLCVVVEDPTKSHGRFLAPLLGAQVPTDATTDGRFRWIIPRASPLPPLNVTLVDSWMWDRITLGRNHTIVLNLSAECPSANRSTPYPTTPLVIESQAVLPQNIKRGPVPTPISARQQRAYVDAFHALLRQRQMMRRPQLATTHELRQAHAGTGGGSDADHSAAEGELLRSPASFQMGTAHAALPPPVQHVPEPYIVLVQRANETRRFAPSSLDALVRGLSAATGKRVRIYSGGESVPQTLDLFANAIAVVGFHGAGLLNILFTPRAACLIELTYYVDLNSSWITRRICGSHIYSPASWAHPAFNCSVYALPVAQLLLGGQARCPGNQHRPSAASPAPRGAMPHHAAEGAAVEGAAAESTGPSPHSSLPNAAAGSCAAAQPLPTHYPYTSEQLLRLAASVNLTDARRASVGPRPPWHKMDIYLKSIKQVTLTEHDVDEVAAHAAACVRRLEAVPSSDART